LVIDIFLNSNYPSLATTKADVQMHVKWGKEGEACQGFAYVKSALEKQAKRRHLAPTHATRRPEEAAPPTGTLEPSNLVISPGEKKHLFL
jgi:hypothetical protein